MARRYTDAHVGPGARLVTCAVDPPFAGAFVGQSGNVTATARGPDGGDLGAATFTYRGPRLVVGAPDGARSATSFLSFVGTVTATWGEGGRCAGTRVVPPRRVEGRIVGVPAGVRVSVAGCVPERCEAWGNVEATGEGVRAYTIGVPAERRKMELRVALHRDDRVVRLPPAALPEGADPVRLDIEVPEFLKWEASPLDLAAMRRSFHEMAEVVGTDPRQVEELILEPLQAQRGTTR